MNEEKENRSGTARGLQPITYIQKIAYNGRFRI
jgi:hypothetical protein